MSMHQHPTITQRTNAIICIKKAIDRLSKDVADDIEYHQAQLIYFGVNEDLNTAFNELNKKGSPPRDACTAKELIDRSIALLSLQPSEERQIELLERGICEEVSKQEVEDKNDDVIGLLTVALRRLGYRRHAV